MQVVHAVCCGLDVHKKSVTACVLWASGRRRQTREFGRRALRVGRLAARLRSDPCSAGVDGRVLEAGVESSGGAV
jgi:transposase